MNPREDVTMKTMSSNNKATYPRHLQEIMEVLSDGKEHTAMDINERTGRNDARKGVSELVAMGVMIHKRTVSETRVKCYRLKSKNRAYFQVKMFEE